MPIYHRVSDAQPRPGDRLDRLRLDERFINMLAPETPQDRLEAQELRQLVHQALQELTPEETEVIVLRYQHKKSPGQVASQLQIPRREMKRREASGLEKLRRHLKDW